MQIKSTFQSRAVQYGIYSTLFIVVILGAMALVNYGSNKWFMRLDLTEGKEYTVSQATKKTLRGLDDIVNIKVFFSKKLPSQMIPTTKKVKDILNEYQAYAKGNLRITYLDPADDPKIEQEASALGIQAVQMDAIEKDQRQIIKGYLGIAIQYADKKELLPLVTEVQDLEYNLTSAIKKLTRAEEPRIGLLSGYGTQALDTVATQARDQLKRQYSVVDVALKEGEKIDTGLKGLVLLGPENLTERAKFEIDQYVMSGGKLLAFVDGVSIMAQYGLNGQTRNHNMNDLLGHYGARISQNLVLDVSCALASFQTQMGGGFMSYFTTPYPLWPKIHDQYLDQENPVVNRMAGLTLPWSSCVDLTLDAADTTKKIKSTVLLRSTKAAWTMQEPFNLDPQKQFNTAEGLKKSQNLAVVLSGQFASFYKGKAIPKFKKEIVDNGAPKQVDTLAPEDAGRAIVEQSPDTRILVMGNSRFITDQFVQQTGGINGAFLMNLVDWMVQDDDLITIRSRKVVDRPLKTTTPAARAAIKWVNVVVMPVLVIGFGLVRMGIRRKKRESVKQGAAQ